jgi:hypothetical protein
MLIPERVPVTGTTARVVAMDEDRHAGPGLAGSKHALRTGGEPWSTVGLREATLKESPSIHGEVDAVDE